MRFKSIILALISIIVLVGCKDDKMKSLSDLKDDQSANIERLIKENKWDIVKLKEPKFPSTINHNVYYLFPNGLYVRVLDEGTKEKAVKDKTHIFLYVDGYMSHKNNKLYSRFNSISDPSVMPIEFMYTEYYSQGDIHYRTIPQIVNGGDFSELMCEGLAYPMSLLGNDAKVSLIIPFELGPSFTYSNGSTVVIQEAIYQFK